MIKEAHVLWEDHSWLCTSVSEDIIGHDLKSQPFTLRKICFKVWEVAKFHFIFYSNFYYIVNIRFNRNTILSIFYNRSLDSGCWSKALDTEIFQLFMAVLLPSMESNILLVTQKILLIKTCYFIILYRCVLCEYSSLDKKYSNYTSSSIFSK